MKRPKGDEARSFGFGTDEPLRIESRGGNRERERDIERMGAREDEDGDVRGNLGQGSDPGAKPGAFVTGESKFVTRARIELLETFF